MIPHANRLEQTWGPPQDACTMTLTLSHLVQANIDLVLGLMQRVDPNMNIPEFARAHELTQRVRRDT